MPADASFPDGFVWGAATSAFQIEGATDADGRGESIWDVFCRRTGVIADGSDGTVACDHYRRWRDDVELVRSLGLGAYRFSVAWPRVIPDGIGAVNQAGLDFYDRLVDALLAAGVEPHVTLFHWDLPQALQRRGGWAWRGVADAFEAYAAAVVDRLGDRVATWVTLNEPYVVANHGYLTGEFAPGVRNVGQWAAATHHLLVAHGRGLQVVRALQPSAKAGIVLNFTPAVAGYDDDVHARLAQLADVVENHWFLHPILGRGYPDDPLVAAPSGAVRAGDMELIAQPIDVLGVNYYTRSQVGPEPDELDLPRTAMGWEIHPDSLRRLLGWLTEQGVPDVMITENGAAFDDMVGEDGSVHDPERVAYYEAHLTAVRDAIAGGAPVTGYFAWSLLDNFEWSSGYAKRFGIVHVDYPTQRRTPKTSARYLSAVAAANALVPAGPFLTTAVR